MLFSMGLSTYKAFDYRSKYLGAEAKKDELDERLDMSRKEVETLTETYNNVIINLSLDSYSINDIALPFWYKVYDAGADDFKMVRFNRAYEEKYGKTPQEYFAHPDPDVIGDIGDEYQTNDRKAFESGKIEIFYERYIDKETGEIKIGKFAKWRIDKTSGIYLFGIQLEL